MPKWAGCMIRREAVVDSTNWQARLWAREGAPHGAAVIAGMQTAGRGRRGRDWQAAQDAGLWFSIVLRPDLPQASWGLLPLAAALAGTDACVRVTGADVRIKWPNDLILSGRKIAGLLVEREGDAAVMGIGINVRQQPADFPEDLREKAGSLEMLTGRPVSMPQLEEALLAEIERRVDTMDFMPEYAARCATVGSAVRVIGMDEEYLGVAEGVDADGTLLVRDETGVLRRVLAGDVSVRGVMGYA